MQKNSLSRVTLILFLFLIPINTVVAELHAFTYGLSKDVKMNKDESYIEVPFHYQDNKYYCGPAALEMVFDYYGEDIPQSEIADVARTAPYVTYTDEMRRARHFSNFSTSSGNEMPGNITGYSLRKLGYGTFEQRGLTISQLKSLIDDGYPIIVLMWFTPAEVYGHYRVVVGYNETHIILHDPWNKEAWGDTYGGPNVTMPEPTFLDLWDYVGYWGLLTCPWEVTLTVPNIAELSNTFNVTAAVTYVCPEPFSAFDYPASSCNVTINLPVGLNLDSGETTKKTLGTGDLFPKESATVSWTVKANNCGTFAIFVEAEGFVSGTVGEHNAYPSYNYEDRIGGTRSDTVQVKRIISVPDDFATIQTAINNAVNGDIIQVRPEIYFENIVVNKTISLIGEDRNTTIIDGNGTAIHVTADNVIISGFTVRNGAIGIWLDSLWNTTVNGNNVNNNDDGIHLFSSRNCLISKNNVSNNNRRGIFLNDSWNSTVSRNTVNHNSWYGINLNSSRNCIVDGNNAENNYWDGIGLYSSENCVIHGNNVKNNTLFGIWLDSSNNNIIYHNNFFHNFFQVSSVVSSNIWDNNIDGNYWSDYNGTDLFSGPYQNDTGSNGIGDIPYSIDVNNTDNYPLMGQFSNFNVMWQEKTCYITTVSNYTISNFHFTSGQISFYVTGLNETPGFCRVSIPLALLNGPYNVTVNGGTPLTFRELFISNNTTIYLYFTYPPTTHQILIVSEFPSVFWPLIIVSSLAFIMWKFGIRNNQQTR